MKNKKYRIGQLVKIIGTGSAMSNTNVQGHCEMKFKIGSEVIITKIDTNYGAACKNDPRYYGNGWNLRGKDLEVIDSIDNYTMY